MSPTLEEIADGLYAEKPTSVLYHYTSLAGLMGIVPDRALRATEVHYVTDASEIRLTAHLLHGAAEALGDRDEFGQRLFSQFLRWLDNRVTELGHAVFVGCFTANGSLLSQWRSYSDPGKGISIGFDPNKLLEAAASQSWRVGQCIYDQTRQHQLAMSMLGAIEALARERFDSPERLLFNALQHFFAEVEADILRIAALLKNHAFVEEQEWRVISPIISNFVGASAIGFREGRSMLIPFMTFELPHGENSTLDIEHVWIGPTPHPMPSVVAITNYLSRQRAHPRRGVSYSGIPYRTW
jgi:hypothetical protein